MSSRRHSEIEALRHSNDKTIYLTVVRYKYDKNVIKYSTSKPCKHCTIQIRNYFKNNKKQQIYIRYIENNVLTKWIHVKYLTDGVVSSGYRQKYR